MASLRETTSAWMGSNRENVIYYGIYHIACAIVFRFIGPLFVMLLTNILILRQLGNFLRMTSSHNEERRKNNQVRRAEVTLIIGAVFIVSHIVKWVLNIYELHIRLVSSSKETISEEMRNPNEWISIVVSLSNSLVVLNSSINFP